MREKLIELLCPHIQHDCCDLFCHHPPCNSVIEAADDLIANGVTVQKKGEWIETKNGFHCSNCKGKPGRHPTQRGVYLSDYCPHCGADMKGAEHEAD